MGDQVICEVVAIHLHFGAHQVKGAGRDELALAVDLPRDGRVRGADVVGTGRASGGAGVDSKVRAELAVDNHATHEVGAKVRLVVDHCEDLALDADVRSDLSRSEGVEGIQVEIAKHSIIEGILVLVRSAASAGGRVGPVNFVGLANLHTDAVLKVVLAGKHGFGFVVVMALKRAQRSCRATVGNPVNLANSLAVLVKLSKTIMFCAKMPVDVDGAKACLEERSRDGLVVNLHIALEALGDVGTCLRTNVGHAVNDAVNIGETRAGAGAGVFTVFGWRLGKQVFDSN
mmetsp:Transcript_16265/g.26539  ORF Transcript_16265/g.26539 Transcript_16265/m.26539 type:complete len:287 (-) Transcript_16265:574-1434(-)